MFRDTTIDNNCSYTECQASYNIWGIDSSNAIIQFTRICASLMGVTLRRHDSLPDPNCDVCAPKFAAGVNLRRHDTSTRTVMNVMTIFR